MNDRDTRRRATCRGPTRADAVPRRHHARRGDGALPARICASRRSARRRCRSARALRPRAGRGRRRGRRRAGLRPLERRRLRRAGSGHVRRDGGDAAHASRSNDEVLAPGVVPRHACDARPRDDDRDRRHAAARRRRRRDGRAHGARRRRAAGSRSRAPSRAGENVSYAGHRHRAGRDGAARRAAAHVARDRRAGGARARRGRRVSPAARGDPLHRQRDRRAGRAAARRRRSTTRTRAIIGAAVEELGGEPVQLGIVADDDAALARGAGDAALQSRPRRLLGRHVEGRGRPVVSRRQPAADPGIVAHGVALKPGKPICLAVTARQAGRDPARAFRRRRSSRSTNSSRRCCAPRGLPPERRQTVAATLPMRVNSERGRTEYLLVGLVQRRRRPRRVSDGQGLRLGHRVQRRRRLHHDRPAHRDPRAGSAVRCNCSGSDSSPPTSSSSAAIASASTCSSASCSARAFAPSRSTSAARAASPRRKRGECDIAGIHLLDPATGEYNRPLLTPTLDAGAGLRPHAGHRIPPRRCAFRRQGRSTRRIAAALARSRLRDGQSQRRQRHAHPDRPAARRPRPPGYGVQTKSHNAVAAAVRQGRADWGVAIDTVARPIRAGLHAAAGGALRLRHSQARARARAVQAFRDVLSDPPMRERLGALGFDVSR